MKKKKLIKAVTLGLAGMMLLSGCAMKKAPSTSSKTESGKNETSINAEVGTSGATKEVTMKVSYANESWFKYEGTETMEKNAWTDLMNENGINFEILYSVEATQDNEKLAQCIMAGEYPDILHSKSTNFKDYAKQGVFADLTEAYEKYGSDATKAYYNSEAGKIALDAATIDGKLYGLPKVADPYNNMTVLWIRKDWLDNLGLKKPETINEFVEVARAFTEDDPDQDGTKNTYGLILNGKDVYSPKGTITGIFEMYGTMPVFENARVPFIEEDGKVIYGGGNADKMKEALTTLNTMYSKGYIPKDFITAGNDQIDQDMSSGKAGMYFGRMSVGGDAWANALETQPNAELIAVPLPGKTLEESGQAFYSALPTEYTSCSNKFEDLETFMKVVNLCTEYMTQPDKTSLEDYQKYNGLAGTYTGWKCAPVRLTAAEKNLKALPKHQKALETGDTSQLNAENLRDYTAMQDYLNNKDRYNELTEDELAKLKTGIFYYSIWGNEDCSYMSIDKMIQMKNFVYSAYDTMATDKMIECSTTLDTLTKETLIDIIIGNKAVDSYEEFLTMWNSLGGEEILAEATAWNESK